MKLSIEAQSAAGIRLVDGLKNDPTGEIRRRLDEINTAWTEATEAQRWEEAAAFEPEVAALMLVLHPPRPPKIGGAGQC